MRLNVRLSKSKHVSCLNAQKNPCRDDKGFFELYSYEQIYARFDVNGQTTKPTKPANPKQMPKWLTQSMKYAISLADDLINIG